MSEPIDTSRSTVERECTALTSTINVHLALDVDLFADRVRALLDERDVLDTKNYDLETEMVRHRVTSGVRLEGLTTWKEVADLHRERAEAAEQERDALVEDAQGQDDRIVQLIQRVEAAEQERGALALSNHFYEGTTTAQRERAEAVEKLLEKAERPHAPYCPGDHMCICGFRDWLTRYAERATPSTEKKGLPNMDIGEFHWRDGLMFRRMDDGSVRIRRVLTNSIETVAHIPLAEWQSIEQAISWAAIHDRPRDPVGTEKEEGR